MAATHQRLDHAVAAGCFRQDLYGRRGVIRLRVPRLRERAVDQFERRYLVSLLEQAKGNVSRAAELARVSRRYVTLLMTKHPLAPSGRRRGA